MNPVVLVTPRYHRYGDPRMRDQQFKLGHAHAIVWACPTKQRCAAILKHLESITDVRADAVH